MKSKKGNIGVLQQTVLAIAVLAAIQACGEGGSSSAGSDFGAGSGGDQNGGTPNVTYDNTQLLENLADNIIVPTYQAFEAKTVSQTTSVTDYCAALEQTPDDVGTQKLNAQNAWRSLSGSWQQAEVMQLGPLAANHNALRNTIYSWPVVSSCGVDQDVVYFELGNINGTDYHLNQRTDTRRGIDALEYLLFNDNLDHSCNGNVGPLGDWNIRQDNERQLARCKFAAEVATDLNTNATTLVNAWAGADGYAAKLKAAGETGSEFATSLDGVNAISDAMFYIDSVTKDAKVGKPLGKFDNNCGNQACPEEVESYISGQSVDNISANVIGFSKLFFGSSNGQVSGEGIGFDDYLIEVGDQQTADRITLGIQQIQELADQLDIPLSQLLSADPAQIEALHSNIKTVTDELKTNFITSLALELPQTSAGDND